VATAAVRTARVTTADPAPARSPQTRSPEVRSSQVPADAGPAEDTGDVVARRGGRAETALLVLGGAAAGWLLVRQVRRVDLPALLDAVQVRWAVVAVALIAASFVGAAWNLMGFSAVRLRVAPTVLVQVAGGFVKVISPAAVGAALVNARYLRRAGASRAETVTSIGAAQSVQFLVTVAFLGGLAALPGSPVSGLRPDPTIELMVVAGVVAVGAVAWCGRRHPRVRRLLDRVRAEAATLATHAARRPGRVALGVAGSVVLVLAFALGLASSVRAFGGHIDLLTVTVVFLAGSAAGSLVPSPGGLGTVEAALVTGLAATGLSPEVALPAVLWFRLVSVWVPVPLGWVAVQALRRRALL
jgi:uncharacterized membrane protein YbhN (UPF0104 family)